MLVTAPTPRDPPGAQLISVDRDQVCDHEPIPELTPTSAPPTISEGNESSLGAEVKRGKFSRTWKGRRRRNVVLSAFAMIQKMAAASVE